MQTLRFTHGINRFDTQWIDGKKHTIPPLQANATWQEYVDILGDYRFTTRHPDEKDKSTPWTSPMLLGIDGEGRGMDNVVGLSSFAAFDIDHPGWTLDRLKAATRGYATVFYTTTKSRPDHQRWRGMIQLDREITVEEHGAIWNFLNNRFDHQLDQQTKNANRIYFVPATWEGADNVFEQVDGVALKVDDVLKEYAPVEMAVHAPISQISGIQTESQIVTDHMVQEFASAMPGGRFWKLLCTAAARYQRNGWNLTDHELCDAALQVSRLYAPNVKRDNAIREARRALAWAAATVQPPVTLQPNSQLQIIQSRKNSMDTFQVLTEQDAINCPPQTYVIDGIIPENSVGFMIGTWGTCKTFACLDIAMTLTTGKGDWHGHNAQSGAVCYIAGEGAGGIGKRIRAWKTHHDLHKNTSPFYLIREPVNMLDAAHVSKLINTIRDLEDRYSIKFKLVVIDTLSRAIQGRKEDEEAFGKVINHSEQIKEAIGNGASVMIVHHKGKDATRGGRGSSVAESNADFVLDIDRDREDNTLTVTTKKLKDDEDGQSQQLLTLPVSWERDGVAQSSLVLVDRRGQLTAKDVQTRMDIANLPVGKYKLTELAKLLGITEHKQQFYGRVRKAVPADGIDVQTQHGLRMVIRHEMDEDDASKGAVIVVKQWS